jgi:coproporphyrinogen III oxidase-like Fe-S oxidoreductase
MFSLYFLLLGARLSKYYSFRYKECKNENNIFLETDYKPNKTYSLYIHIPFCENLCEFCFFHKFPYNENNIIKYYKALIDEIDLISKKDFKINNVYIGGGTPTIYLPGLINLLEKVNNTFNVQSISIETDPFHINEQAIKLLKNANVNRLSIGIQSFNEHVLNKAGRINKTSIEEMEGNIRTACEVFETVNIDLIFNFKKQNIRHINFDMEKVLELCPQQITYYPIMEHNKRLFDDIVNTNRERKIYYYIIDNLQKFYSMNSVWSFALKNNIYDEYLVDNLEFLCAGCGAFGYYQGILYANSFNLDNYINKINKGRLPIVAYKKLNSFEKIMYLLTIKLYSLKFNKYEITKTLDNGDNKIYRSLINYLKMANIIHIDKDYISLTKHGLYHWLNVMKHFYINVNTLREFCRFKQL